MTDKIFTEKDYNSNDGMLTSVWGPALWHTLHTISFNYPTKPTKEQKDHYYKFYKSLKHTLPCKYCRDNYSNNLKQCHFGKKVFKNRATLSRWVYDLHENVNKMLNKKSKLSYEDVRDRYEHFRSRCLSKPNTHVEIENGCTEPLYGMKSKCVINIVPRDGRKPSFKMDPRCKLSRNPHKKK